jgi:hypothetical protein
MVRLGADETLFEHRSSSCVAFCPGRAPAVKIRNERHHRGAVSGSGRQGRQAPRRSGAAAGRIPALDQQSRFRGPPAIHPADSTQNDAS